MDEKIRELRTVLSDKDLQLENLRETVRLLQEKVEGSNAVVTESLAGQEEVPGEVDDNN